VHNNSLSVAELTGLLGELEAAGAFSRDARGTIFSRHMVRERDEADTGRKNATKQWPVKRRKGTELMVVGGTEASIEIATISGKSAENRNENPYGGAMQKREAPPSLSNYQLEVSNQNPPYPPCLPSRRLGNFTPMMSFLGLVVRPSPCPAAHVRGGSPAHQSSDAHPRTEGGGRFVVGTSRAWGTPLKALSATGAIEPTGEAQTATAMSITPPVRLGSSTFAAFPSGSRPSAPR